MYFIPPELIQGKMDSKGVVWSLGVLLYTSLSGIPPFYAETVEETIELIEKGVFFFEGQSWDNISEEAKDII